MFPPGLVDEVIAEAGRTQRRSRSLPARVMAYFAIGMALYSEGSYEDVLAQLSDGLAWASGWQDRYVLPSKSAIFQARARLGAEPLQALFERWPARSGSRRRRRGRGRRGGWPVVGWWQLTGRVWMWPTHLRMRRSSVGRG